MSGPARTTEHVEIERELLKRHVEWLEEMFARGERIERLRYQMVATALTRLLSDLDNLASELAAMKAENGLLKQIIANLTAEIEDAP